MGLLKKTLPVTSYGYRPPSAATARGWACTNWECGAGENEPVRRWPKSCQRCGSPADPLFDDPWKHDAEGAELQWLLRNHPERGGGFHQDQWEVWQFRDAARRGDSAAVAQARTRVRAYAAIRSADSWWIPGNVFFHLVWIGLVMNDLDGAADDLCFWLGVSTAEDVANDNATRTNCRQVIDSAQRFLTAPGAAVHPRAQQIRHSCLTLAEGAFTELNREQQNAIIKMAEMT